MLAGIVLRSINLNSGLWLDEIWSMRTSASSRSIAEIVAACMADTHPPLFDLLLNLWMKVFGDTDFSGRLFALWWGVAGLIATWFYTLKLTTSRSTAFLALTLVTFNYFHIYYSNEVRFYGLLYLQALLILAHLYLYLKQQRLIHLLILTGVSALALYTHYYAVFLLAAVGVGMLILIISRKISARQFISVAAAGIVAVLLFVPWMPYMLQGGTSESWMQVPAWYDFINYFYLYTGKNPIEFLFLVLFSIGGFMLYKRLPLLVVLCGSLVVFGFIFPLLASHLVVPMLHERYTMIYLPAIFILAAVGFNELVSLRYSTKWAIVGVVVVSVVVNLTFIHPYFRTENKEPWKAIAGDLATDHRNLPVYSEMEFWLNYYLHQKQIPDAQIPGDYSSDGAFWYVATPYDVSDEGEKVPASYQRTEVREYKNGFRLMLMQEVSTAQ